MKTASVLKLVCEFLFAATIALAAPAQACELADPIDLGDETCAKQVLEALIWSGYYEASIASDLKKHIEEGLQKFRGEKAATGARLSLQDYKRLVALGAGKKKAAGFAAVNLAAQEIRLGLPLALLRNPDHPAVSKWGPQWTSSDNAFSIVVLSYNDGRTLGQVFEKLQKIPNRTAETSQLLKDWLLVRGSEGSSDFLVMMRTSAKGLKGFSISYSHAAKARYAAVAAAMSLQFAEEDRLLPAIGLAKAKKDQPGVAASTEPSAELIAEAQANTQRGAELFQNGALDEALAEFNKALAKAPNQTLALQWRARIEFERHDYTATFLDLDRVILIDADSTEPRYAKGIYYLNLKQFDSALKQFARCIELDPRDALCFYYRASSYSGLKNEDKAAQDMAEALRLDPGRKILPKQNARDTNQNTPPDYVRTTLQQGWNQVTSGQSQEALKAAQTVIEMEPGNADGYLLRGYVWLSLDNTDKAMADANTVIKMQPDFGEAYFLRGQCSFSRTQMAAAVADYEKALAFDPKNERAMRAKAWALFKLGRTAEALPLIEKAVESRPADAYYLNERAQILEAAGRKQQAILDFRTALALQPDLQESIDGLNRLVKTE